MQEMARRFFFIWGGTVSVWGMVPEHMRKEMATHSSVLAWRIPGTGKPMLSMGSHWVGHIWSDLAAVAAAPEWYMRIASDIQNAVQLYPVIHDDKKKKLLSKHHCIIFSREYLELNPTRNLCHQNQAWVKLQLALHLLLLIIFHLYPLPPLLPQVSNFSCLFIRWQTLYASWCTILLYFFRYCTIRFKIFSCFLCLFFMYYLYEKYYKLITVQYYIFDYVNWVPRLPLDLRINWT